MRLPSAGFQLITGAPGNEGADECAKAAAEGGEPDSAVPGEYRWETSLSCMTRAATEVRSQSTAQWTTDHVGPQSKYRPPRGKGLKRKLSAEHGSRSPAATISSLSGHAAIGPYLKDKIYKTDDDRCWWCGGGCSRPAITFYGVQGLATPEQRVVEGYGEDAWVGTPKGPLG